LRFPGFQVPSARFVGSVPRFRLGFPVLWFSVLRSPVLATPGTRELYEPMNREPEPGTGNLRTGNRLNYTL